MANTFNPADTIIRNGWEANAPGLQALTLDGYHRLGPGGELLSPTYEGVPLGEIDGEAVDTGDILTVVTLGPKAINLRLRNDPGSLRYIANFFGFSATPTTPSGATLARQHILDRNQTDVAFDRSLTVDISRSNGIIWSHRGAEVQQLIFTFEGGELTNLSALIMWRHFTTFADKVVEVPGITPATEEFELSGLFNQTNFDLGIAADANKLTVKVSDITNIAATPIPSIVALAAVGAVPAYGTDPFTIQGGLKPNGEPRLNEVLDSNGGQPIGTCRLPALLAVTDLTGYEVDDETSWLQKAEWVPTLGTAPFFNNACATVIIDGEKEIVNSCTVTLTKPKRLPGGGSWVGSGFPETMTDTGRVRHEIVFEKDQQDSEIVEKILFAKQFDFSIDLHSDVFIDAGTQFDDRFLLELFDAKPVAGSEQKTSTAEDAVPETLTTVASGTPPARATIITPLTDLAV